MSTVSNTTKRVVSTKLVYMGLDVMEVVIYSDCSYRIIKRMKPKRVYVVDYSNINNNSK